MGRRTYEAMVSLPEEHPDTGGLAQRQVRHEDLADEIRRLKADSDVPLRTNGSLCSSSGPSDEQGAAMLTVVVQEYIADVRPVFGERTG